MLEPMCQLATDSDPIFSKFGRGEPEVPIQKVSRENRCTNCRGVEEAVRRLFIGISSLTSAALAAASLGSSPVFEDPNVWPVPCLGGCEGAGRECEVDDGIGAEVRCGAEPRTRPVPVKLSPDSLLPKHPMAVVSVEVGGKTSVRVLSKSRR